MIHLSVFTYISLFLALIAKVSGLNILIVGNSPYGSVNNQILHKYLQHDSTNRIITISPLSQFNEGDNEISVDNSDLSEGDLNYYLDNADINLSGIFGLRPGAPWYDNGYNILKGNDAGVKIAESLDWTKDMWYVKGSPIGSLLFGLDYLIPDIYGDVSIDLVIVGPSLGSTSGLHEQSYKNNFQMMRLCLMRNIPAINLSGLDSSGLSRQIMSFDEASTIVDQETRNDDLPGMIYAYNTESIIKGLKLNDFGFHNFESSKLKLVNKVNDERDKSLNSKLEHHSLIERSNKVKRVLPNGVGLNVNVPLVGSASLTKETCQTPRFVHTKSFGGYNKIPALKYEANSKDFSFEEIYNVDENLNDADSRSIFELNSRLRSRDESIAPGTKSSELSISSDCYISITPVNFRGYDELTNLKFMYRLTERLNTNNFTSDFLSESEFYDDYEIEDKLSFQLLAGEPSSTEGSTVSSTKEQEYTTTITVTEYPVYEDDTFLTAEEVEELRLQNEKRRAEAAAAKSRSSGFWSSLSNLFHLLMKY